MKKTVALLLTFIVCFSLCACGKASKEELLKSAEEVSASRLHDELGENIVKVKEQYVGKSYKVTGRVSYITEDYVDLGSLGGARVYLSNDELAKLEQGTYITVVGKFDGIETDEVRNDIYITMKNAYFVTDEFEIEGKISQIMLEPNRKNYTVVSYAVVNTRFVGDVTNIKVYLTDNTSQEYENGDLIKAKGKISAGDMVVDKVMEEPQMLYKTIN